MRKIMNWTLCVLISNMFLISCVDDDFKGIGSSLVPSADMVEGDWALSSITQVDVNAENNGLPAKIQTLDLGTRYDYSNYSISFTKTGSNDGNFSANIGNTPSLFPSSGSFEIKATEEDGPLGISLSGKESLEFQKVFRPEEGKLSLVFVRKGLVDGKEVEVVKYQYDFDKK